MDEALRLFILLRDKECLAYKFNHDHQCRDRWGTPHRPDALDLLTIEHVKDQPKIGQAPVKRVDKHRTKAPDDKEHMVAMCWAANVGAPSHSLREFCRDHLAKVNGALDKHA